MFIRNSQIFENPLRFGKQMKHSNDISLDDSFLIILISHKTFTWQKW